MLPKGKVNLSTKSIGGHTVWSGMVPPLFLPFHELLMSVLHAYTIFLSVGSAAAILTTFEFILGTIALICLPIFLHGLWLTNLFYSWNDLIHKDDLKFYVFSRDEVALLRTQRLVRMQPCCVNTCLFRRMPSSSMRINHTTETVAGSVALPISKTGPS